MGDALIGTGRASGETKQFRLPSRHLNPLLEGVSIRGARGVLVNITGGADIMSLMR